MDALGQLIFVSGAVCAAMAPAWVFVWLCENTEPGVRFTEWLANRFF